MKHLLLLTAFAGLLFFGCQNDEFSPVGPDSTEPYFSQVSEPNWVGLPVSNFQFLAKTFSTSKLVKADKDTELIIDESYSGGPHGEVKVIVKLKFYSGSVDQDTQITMEIDDQTGVISFSPSMVFNKPAELYIKLEGLDLNDDDEENVDFVYLTVNGTYEAVEYDEIEVDTDDGELELKEGEVDHFSRYGFVR